MGMDLIIVQSQRLYCKNRLVWSFRAKVRLGDTMPPDSHVTVFTKMFWPNASSNMAEQQTTAKQWCFDQSRIHMASCQPSGGLIHKKDFALILRSDHSESESAMSSQSCIGKQQFGMAQEMEALLCRMARKTRPGKD